MKEVFLMQEKRTHKRIPLKTVRETPADGVYITNNDLRNYGAFAGLLFLLLSAFAFLGKKCRNRRKNKKDKKKPTDN